MLAGVRLTHLNNGEPLLGAQWGYKNRYGVDAVEERLKDLFWMAKNLGFSYVIDTLNPKFDINGNLNLNNNGNYGSVWSIEERMQIYQTYSTNAKLKIFLEIDFPTTITEQNVELYANYFINNLVGQYPWVDTWQFLVNPDQFDEYGQYKCTPALYVKFLKLVQPKIKLLYNGIKLAGPGTFDSFVEYAVNNNHNGWMAEVLGEKYGYEDKYTSIGPSGLLPYIDIFTIQGWQNTVSLNYTNFPQAIDKIQTIINTKAERNLSIFSIEQGWKAEHGDSTSLYNQSYYNIREMLNCAKKGVVPMVRQLVDEYYDQASYEQNFNNSLLNYGFIEYFAGEGLKQPICKNVTFLFNALNGFNNLYTEESVAFIEENEDINYVTLVNNEKTKTATVLWCNTNTDQTVVLNAHYARTYLEKSNLKTTLSSPIQINMDDSRFIVIYEELASFTEEDADIESMITAKANYFKNTLGHLVQLLPSSYNKETRDVNYYKLLRAVSLEMADAKYQVDVIKDNAYIDSVQNDMIYQNFGCLVNLKKRHDWDNEKYLTLVSGVMKSLLDGPTPDSIINAVKLFTNFEVKIHELYKDSNDVDQNILSEVYPQFAFVVEIDKPLDAYVDQESLYRDVKYIINIVKPAHTLSIVVIFLVGTEDYRNSYKQKHGIEFYDSDELTWEANNLTQEALYGWRYQDYPGVLETIGTNGVYTNNTLTNGSMFIGPRYVLYDYNSIDMESNNNHEHYEEVVEEILYYLEIDGYEKFITPEEKIFTEFDYSYKEAKFGIDYDPLIKTNGGMLRDSQGNVIDNEGRILNKYRLGVHASKLKDTYVFDYEGFYTDKYHFRNALNALKFTTPEGFVTGKFSPNIPDKAIIFGMHLFEHSFREKIINLMNGNFIIVERIIEKYAVNIDKNEAYDVKTELKEYSISELESFMGEFIYVHQFTEKPWILSADTDTILNKNLLYGKGPLFKEYVQFTVEHYDRKVWIETINDNSLCELQMFSLYEIFDKQNEEYNMFATYLYEKFSFKNETDYIKTNINQLNSHSFFNGYSNHVSAVKLELYELPIEYQDKLIAVNINYNLHEYIRPEILSPEHYHIHKTIENIIQNDEKTVYVYGTDVFEIRNNDDDSVIRVYINGVLVPYWFYEEIPSIVDVNYANGIRIFPDNVNIGDQVTLIYLTKRKINYLSFPWKDSDSSEVVFGDITENYPVVQCVIDESDVNVGFFEQIKQIEDISIFNSFEQVFSEKYKKVIDVYSFPAQQFQEVMRWAIQYVELNDIDDNPEDDIIWDAQSQSDEERKYIIELNTLPKDEDPEYIALDKNVVPDYIHYHDIDLDIKDEYKIGEVETNEKENIEIINMQSLLMVEWDKNYLHEQNIKDFLCKMENTEQNYGVFEKDIININDNNYHINCILSEFNDIYETKYDKYGNHLYCGLKYEIFDISDISDEFLTNLIVSDVHNKEIIDIMSEFNSSLSLKEDFSTILDINNLIVTGEINLKNNSILNEYRLGYGGIKRVSDAILSIYYKENKENHKLTSNLDMAFKFGSSEYSAHKFNNSKFSTVPLIDFPVIEYNPIENINLKSIVSVIPLREVVLTEINDNVMEKYLAFLDNNYHDFYDFDKVDVVFNDFNSAKKDVYFLKSAACNLVLFKIRQTTGQSLIIKQGTMY